MKDPRTLFFRKGALGWIVCLVFLSHLTKLPAQTSTPYQNDFETADGFISGNPGELPEWLFSPEVLPSLNSDAASGLQSLSLLGDGSVSIDFLQDIGASIGWVDFYLKPTISLETDLPVTIAPTQAAITGFVDFGTNGSIFAIDGDGLGSGSWFDTLSTFDLSGNQANQWMRLSYRLDYLSKTWDLFVDGAFVAYDIGFLDDSINYLGKFTVEPGANSSTSLDFFYAGPTNPLYADTSNDGLPDSWLQLQGLDTLINQRY
ncbi:MAG: hypothetical protein AAGB06_04990, partial [Verrucomicrobiota bacterium]